VTVAADDTSKEDVARYEALAEAAYSEMYETRSPAGSYSDMKDYFAMAIAAAERAGLPDEAKRLNARLESCKKVYRSQFSQF
jgi:hypothetical protein